MPKVIFHLKQRQIGKISSNRGFDLYRVIERMIADAGAETEWRVRDADIRIGTRQVTDSRFEDGNLHIIDDRHVYMPNVLNAAPAYLPGFWHLDPKGIRSLSSIGSRPFRSDMVPFQYAKRFYGRLQQNFKDQRRSRHGQEQEHTSLPAGAVAVFFQGSYPRETGATQFSDLGILHDVLDGAGDRAVLVKPHPLTADVESLSALLEIARQNSRVILTQANIHDILAVSCVSVSVNSGVAVEGFLHRTPAILYGSSDLHHMAETITRPGRFAAALERALACTGGYAQFMTWYFRRNCLEIGAPDLEQKIWEILAGAGFPRQRFASG
ncbi:hypothetical protein [Leisingera sp. F5]|uniref:hypothetical protein n=1 Tax=Leisingera sp. F5 TaxID=1813816 RepID=UPI000AF0BC29|nr:hypothetical protein [Leisingera sp. F5]